MKFGPVPVRDAVGAIIAHAVRAGDVVLKKGVVVRPEDVARLLEQGVETVVVARLETDDVGEDRAATELAHAVAGVGVRVEAPFTGRSNLFAQASGVLDIHTGTIDAINAIDETITVATLPHRKAVVAGEMIGTVKIIPFAVPRGLLDQAIRLAAASITVLPYRPKRVAVISTLLPGLKPSVVDKTLKVMAERVSPAGVSLVLDERVPHEAAALAQALRGVTQADIIVVFGASAITDRADVIPQAIERAGGAIEHLGMPVDPGNLLLIGHLGAIPVIGAPGCARSPRENGFDWVLQRLLADIPVTRADIQRMGVGGLLMEIVSRPQPRDPTINAAVSPAGPWLNRTDVLVLAAGRSTRMQGPNKLLALHRGKPLVRHTVENALAAAAGPVSVVTGHQRALVEEALAGLPVRFVDNPDFAQGMSTSVKAGIAALPPESLGAVVVLGDMPLVSPAIIRRLAQVFVESPGVKAVVPTTNGERGNPVFVARALFVGVAQLSGDVGARKLLDAAGADIAEVAVDDAGIHRDFDTPEALATLQELR